MGKGSKANKNNKKNKPEEKKKAEVAIEAETKTPTTPTTDVEVPTPAVAGPSRRRSVSVEPQSDAATTPPVFATPPTSPIASPKTHPVDSLPSPPPDSESPPEVTEPLEPTPGSIISELELVEIEPEPEPIPSTPSGQILSAFNDIPLVSASDLAANNQDLADTAELFATMKQALGTMTDAYTKLQGQSERMIQHGLDLQAAEQLKQLRVTLQVQIQRQKLEVDDVRKVLEATVKIAIQEAIRQRLREIVRLALRDVVKGKVRDELSTQLPEDLRLQVISHQRQILEVKTTLHNSEARRYNALQTSTTSNARLRPLLRPLPTPEQSPIYPPPISRSSSIEQSAMPTPVSTLSTMNSRFPAVPAPTPIRRSVSNPFTPTVTWSREPPTASALFPPDLKSLFSLGPEDTRRLLRDYGLASAAATPALEKPPKERALPAVYEESGSGGDESEAEIRPKLDKGKQKEVDIEDEDSEAHAADMNRFMAHIGVPFLMVPAPRGRDEVSVPMSSTSRRRRLLTPLIIK